MGFCKWPQPGLFPGTGADYWGWLVVAVTGKEVRGSGPLDQSSKETGRDPEIQGAGMGLRNRLHTQGEAENPWTRT